jgi:hypothetical protein
LVAEAAEVGVVAAALVGSVAAVVEEVLVGSAVAEVLEVAVAGRAGDEEPGIEKTKQARSRLR